MKSVKSVSDLYAPVSGKVIEINSDLEDQPELVNESPYDRGWMVKLTIDPADLAALMDRQSYADLVAEEV